MASPKALPAYWHRRGPVIWRHDEIVLEVREDNAERAAALLEQAMTLAFEQIFRGCAAHRAGLRALRTVVGGDESRPMQDFSGAGMWGHGTRHYGRSPHSCDARVIEAAGSARNCHVGGRGRP